MCVCWGRGGEGRGGEGRGGREGKGREGEIGKTYSIGLTSTYVTTTVQYLASYPGALSWGKYEAMQYYIAWKNV